MIEDFHRCWTAVEAKDPRFDGWFFTAVTTSGIYCRPSCPVTATEREQVSFYPSAAAAQQAGFRSCQRCRPDAAPGSPEWDRRGDVVARAIRLIADGIIDRSGVPGLADQLGHSVGQLQRLLMAEIGAGPTAIARAQRAQTARTLLETTTLSTTEVASAAGFSSTGQFNEAIRGIFALTPRQLRPRPRSAPMPSRDGLLLSFSFREPLCPDNLFGHLAATAIPGVEEVRDGAYRRTLRLPHGSGIVALTPERGRISCRMTLTDWRDLTSAVARCRWLLDLDADPEGIDQKLAADPKLRPLVARAPGRRVPRCVDGAELAIRAVLGQQISTAAARTHAGRIAVAFGEPVTDPGGGLTHLFPSPGSIDPARVALPANRRSSLGAVLEALARDQLKLTPGCDREAALAALERLPGVGPWTLAVIAMRALGDPDAFPGTDLGVRRAATALGLPASPRALAARAERWRPYRAYAVQHLWSVTPHAINQWPVARPR